MTLDEVRARLRHDQVLESITEEWYFVRRKSERKHRARWQAEFSFCNGGLVHYTRYLTFETEYTATLDRLLKRRAQPLRIETLEGVSPTRKQRQGPMGVGIRWLMSPEHVYLMFSQDVFMPVKTRNGIMASVTYVTFNDCGVYEDDMRIRKLPPQTYPNLG